MDSKSPAEVALKAGMEVGADKVAGLLGKFFPFFEMHKEAVEAYIDAIRNDESLPPEIKMMKIEGTKKTFKELKNQASIAKIAFESAKEGTDFSESSTIDEDWVARFMDSAKFVSNEESQIMWGRILAGEYERPNNTPPQAIRVLSEITQYYAQAFVNLCNLKSKILLLDLLTQSYTSKEVLILSYECVICIKLGLDLQTLSELQNHGLIKFSSTALVKDFSKEVYPKLYIVYGNNAITIIDYPEKSCR